MPEPTATITAATTTFTWLNTVDAAFLDGQVETTTSKDLGMQFANGHPRARWDKK